MAILSLKVLSKFWGAFQRTYMDEAWKTKTESQGKTGYVLRKGTRRRKLTSADQLFDRRSNRTGAKVEHIVGTVKKTPDTARRDTADC